MLYTKLSRSVLLLLLLSNSLAYSDVSSIPLPFWNKIKKSEFTQFFAKKLQLTLFEYDGSLGVADLFIVGERHHYWAQLGFLDNNLSNRLGIGAGYRYLFRESSSNQDWFLGAYAQARSNIKSPLHYVSVRFGAELATANFQWTVSQYSVHRDKEKPAEAQAAIAGYSLKLSTSYFDKLNRFGKLCPFVFFARSKTQKTHEKALTSDPIWNSGVGIRWQLPYITLEFKADWDSIKPGKLLGLNYHAGCQINFSQKVPDRNEPNQRVHQRPEPYEPASNRKNSKVIKKPSQDIGPASNRESDKDTGKPGQDIEVSKNVECQNLDYFMKILTENDSQKEIKNACDCLIDAIESRLEDYKDPETKTAENQVSALKNLKKQLDTRYKQLLSQARTGKRYAKKTEGVDLPQMRAQLANLRDQLNNETESIISKSQNFLEKQNEQIEILAELKAECMAYEEQNQKFIRERIDKKALEMMEAKNYSSILDTLINAMAVVKKQEEGMETTIIDNLISNSDERCLQVASTIVSRLKYQGRLKEFLKQVKNVHEANNRAKGEESITLTFE